MKPSPLRYVKARSLDHALDLVADDSVDRRVLAGGQSLVPALNLRLVDGVELIDVNGLDDLRGIADEGTHLRIGAMTRHARLGGDPLVREHAPLLAAAVPLIAHAAIRTRGTIGGSIANADPAAELPACALVLEATLVLASRRGERRVAAADFFHGLFETDRAQDEILVAIEVPKAGADHRQAIDEIVRRAGDYALAGLAVAGPRETPRLAFFGVGDRPVLAEAAMAALASGAGLEAAVEALGADLDPPSDIHASGAYRRHVSGVLLRRMLSGDARPS